MKFSPIQQALMDRLQSGDVLQVRISTRTGSSGYRFDIRRNSEHVFIGRLLPRKGRLTIATIDSLARIGALRLTTPEDSPFWRDYEPTPDGLSVADGGMTIAEKEAMNVCIDRIAPLAPTGRR